MARPTVTRQRRAVQVEQPVNTPGLDVVAPINVAVPAAGGEGWGRLQDALGIAGRAYAQREEAKKAMADKSKAQGLADAQFDRVDQKRMSAEDKYAEGVVEYSYLGQYQQARANVLQRASTDLDATLTVDEKAAWLDAEMDKELGSLLDEPRFREVIGPRYAEFINQFAAQEINATLKENEQQALDTETATVNEDLDTDSFNYQDTVNRLSKVVGRSAAVDQVVDIIATYAEQKGDRKILEQIPTSITTEDGQTLAGPRNTPKHRDRLNLALERIRKTEDERTRQAVGATQLSSFVMYDDMVRNGEIITEETFKRNGHIVSDDDPRASLSVAQARSLIDQSKEAHERLLKDSRDKSALMDSVRLFGGFYNAIGQEGGPKNSEEARKAFQWVVKDHLQYVADQAGGTAADTTPIAMVRPDHEGFLTETLAFSAKEGIAYEPLKLIMSEVTPAAPGLVVARLDAYKRMKAMNVAGLYVDDDAAALYEAAIVAEQAGEGPDKLKESIRRLGDPDVKAYVDENAPKSSLRGKSFDITVPGRFFDGSSNDVFNRGYMDGRMDALIRVGLSRNLTPSQAQEFAKQRFAEAHEFVDIAGKTYALPRAELRDTPSASKALTFFATDVARSVAEKAGFTPESAQLNVTTVNGRELQFYITDGGGNALSGYFTVEQAIAAWRKRFPSQVREAANKANEQVQQARKTNRAYNAEHAGDAVPDRPGFGAQK